MKEKRIVWGIVIISVIIISIICILFYPKSNNVTEDNIKVDITSLTYTKDNNSESIKTYTQDDFNTFLTDYQSNNLPEVYITEFLFDGVSMYKPYDLDDFIEEGNDTNIDVLKVTAFNINTNGNIELTGENTNAMVAINTNNVKNDINLLLNNVKIDTDSKKIPAILVYNKDTTYTDTKVTIKSLDNTKNYIEGGKLKKVSLLPSDNLEEYTSKYTNKNQTNYENYTNYYGVYTKEQINNILFTTVTADNEDLSDGDPYYYYKASGAISSDIDLYFEGTGYLEVTSKNKEGIETKGNLTFSGSTGDYVINSQDDCLNTTTDSKEVTNARNTLTIDVNSLYAIVSNDADEGDAIDSNGELIINGGTIVALAKSGSDAGIDSETGTYINSGTILATGDMYDEVKSDSKQNFIVLSFGTKPQESDLITLLDENDKVIFAYKTDRTYTNLIYSSKDLTNANYYLYKNGTIQGDETNGYYTNITSYEKGTQLAYSTKGQQGGMGGMQPGNMNDDNRPDMQNTDDNDSNRPTPPSDDNNTTPPERHDNNNNQNNNSTPPEKPDGEKNNMEPPSNNNQQFGNINTNTTASNKEFVIDNISNIFSNVATYSE